VPTSAAAAGPLYAYVDTSSSRLAGDPSRPADRPDAGDHRRHLPGRDPAPAPPL